MGENDRDPDQPQAVFTGTIRTSPETDRWIVEVPRNVDVATGESYTVALYPPDETVPPSTSGCLADQDSSTPPVDEGEFIDVVIKSVGDEGDGVAKIQGGYTVFVPDGTPGERVTVEIETAKPRFAFATIRARLGPE